MISNPYLLTIISGILLLLSFPPFNLHFLVWIALVPFLYAIVNTKFKKEKRLGLVFHKASILGGLLGIVFYFGTLYWFYTIFKFSAIALILILCFYLYFYAYLLNFMLSNYKNKFAIIYLPSILWVAIEYIKSEGWWLKFSWINLGYSQHNFLPILQFAGIFGQYGISLLIVLVNSIIVFLIINKKNKEFIRNTLIALFLFISLILFFGYNSLKEIYNPNIKIGLVQDESSEFSVYESLSQQFPEDTNFILWPEYSVPEFLDKNNILLDKIRNLTKKKNSYLILGSKDESETYSSKLKASIMRKQGYPEEDINKIFKYYNTAFLFSPEGKPIGRYYKMNPIQFFADGVPGKNFSVFETNFGKISIMICYDADYSYVARNLVKNGAEILFIPTYDAMRWTGLQHKQHSAMTSMRAVENGRFIARSATSGISQIIDPKGRITSSIDIGKSNTITTGFIEKLDKKTFYTKYGFILPYICIAISLIFCIYFLKNKKKN